MATVAIAGSTFTFPIALHPTADTKLLLDAPTIGAADFRKSVNGGALVALDNIPTVTPAGGCQVLIVLSAAETTAAGAGGYIAVYWRDAVGAQWCSDGCVVFVHAGEVAWEVWEELLTGATHNTPTSAGRRLRGIANTVVFDGTVVSALTNSVVLDGGSSDEPNLYRGCIAVPMTGLGAGQPRVVVEYVGAAHRCMLDRPWVVIPAPADEIVLYAAAQEMVISFGTVVSATAGTIKLAATESVQPNIYRYNVIVVTSSTGADSEARLITAYDGPSQTVSVAPNWTVTPNPGDVYKIIPVGRAVTESISDNAITATTLAAGALTAIAAAVWNRLTTALTTVGSIGKYLLDKLALITSGSIAVTSPIVAGGDVTTYRGDDYHDTEGRALDWQEATFPTLTGLTITVIIKGVAQFTGSVPAADTARLELTGTQTATIPAGRHLFQVLASGPGIVGHMTLVEASWVSRPRAEV